MRFSLLLAVALALFGAVVSAAPDRAGAVMGLSRQAIAPLQERQFFEEAASRNKRAAKRRAYRHPRYTYRRPYYVPYACARPHQNYYWQFWPPVCYPL